MNSSAPVHCPVDTPDAGHVRWAAVRRPPRAGDDVLMGPTRKWLQRLPPRRRPLHLCERFPRVANRIAWCWADPLLRGQVLEDLLVDRRGGRAGFPAAIVMELRRLRDFDQRPLVADAAAAPWTSAREMACS